MANDVNSTAAHDTVSRARMMALIPLGIGLNLALGALVHALRLPVFLDAVGTISVTLICGWRAGMTVGVLSFLIAGLLINPVLVWFSATQAVIALYTHVLGRGGWFRSMPRTVLTGIGLGIVAGMVSAPVIVLVFGGISGSGQSLITAFFLKTGRQLLESVALAGIASEPLDKTLQCLLAVWLLRGVPDNILKRFTGGSLRKNGFLKEVGEDPE